jgi:hypothetical protein
MKNVDFLNLKMLLFGLSNMGVNLNISLKKMLLPPQNLSVSVRNRKYQEL